MAVLIFFCINYIVQNPSVISGRNVSFLRVAFGNCNGLAVVDFMQKTVLLSMGTIDLYGSSDPYQRQPRSPRKSKQFAAGREKKHSCCELYSVLVFLPAAFYSAFEMHDNLPANGIHRMAERNLIVP